MFATDRAYELVAEGMPFRDAYQQVKEKVLTLENMLTPFKCLIGKIFIRTGKENYFSIG